MREGYRRSLLARALGVVAMTVVAAQGATAGRSAHGRTSTPFAGVKANTGRVALSGSAGSLVLTLSEG